MTAANGLHPWTVTAPWYAWPLAGVPSSGRGSAPLIQKFASDNFVNAFIKDPQHSLEFDADADQVYTAQLVQAQPGQSVWLRWPAASCVALPWAGDAPGDV